MSQVVFRLVLSRPVHLSAISLASVLAPLRVALPHPPPRPSPPLPLAPLPVRVT